MGGGGGGSYSYIRVFTDHKNKPQFPREINCADHCVEYTHMTSPSYRTFYITSLAGAHSQFYPPTGCEAANRYKYRSHHPSPTLIISRRNFAPTRSQTANIKACVSLFHLQRGLDRDVRQLMLVACTELLALEFVTRSSSLLLWVT